VTISPTLFIYINDVESVSSKDRAIAIVDEINSLLDRQNEGSCDIDECVPTGAGKYGGIKRHFGYE
jgi:hypothetical protein